jgi:STE24 endopeptidase
MTVLQIPAAFLGRRYEYRADRMAAELGYGGAMVTVLKKLTRDNFADLNPHPVIVVLEHNHPTVSARIKNIMD